MALLDHFTSGGQLTIHNWRMFKQVMLVSTKFLVLLLLVVAGLKFFQNTSEYERHVMWKYNEAQMKLIFNKEAVVQIQNPDGRVVTALAMDVANAKYTNEVVDFGIAVLLGGLVIGAYWSLSLFLIIAVVFAIIGKKSRETKHTRGAQLLEPKELTKAIKRHNKKQRAKVEYSLAGIPYPYQAEYKHTQFPGSTGTGKSVLTKKLIQQARQNGDGGVIYAYTPDQVQEFYDETSDIILNPFDARCAPYSIFNDVESRPHLDMIMSALIPDPAKGADPFWNQGARTLAAESAWKVREAYRRHALKNGEEEFHVPTQALTQRLLKTDLTDLAIMIRNSPAAAIVDPDKPGTATSLRAILSTYLDCLKYLPDQTAGFSIRDWMKNRKPGSFLFITSRADMHESLKPLITLWVDLTINALMSSVENRDRHFWLFFDEVPTLQKLPSLINGMAVSRNFGGCFVIGYQGPYDLVELYGDAGAKRIWNLCNTRFILNMPDFDNARWAANNFGKTEAEDVQINRTFGAHDVRDGVSQNHKTELSELVLPSEIMELPDLTGYLRYPKGFPATKVSYPYFQLPKRAESFIPLEDSELLGSQESIELPPLHEDEFADQSSSGDTVEKKETKKKKTTPKSDSDKKMKGPDKDNVVSLFDEKQDKKSKEKGKKDTTKEHKEEAPTGSKSLDEEIDIDFDPI